MTTKEQFTAEISLFSSCDVAMRVAKLATFSMSVTDGPEALKVATVMMAITPHAATAFYNVPDHPNQNTRNGWINLTSGSKDYVEG